MLGLGFVLLLSAACAGCARAQPFATEALGFESVAAIEDARALRWNPAAMGSRYPFEIQWGYTREVAQPSRGGGSLSLAWRHVGFHADRSRQQFRRYGVGFAAGTDALRLGWTANVLAPDGQGGPSVGDHLLGALSRPRPWLSLGASVAHLNAPRFRGVALSREYTGAIGLRPFALSRTAAHGMGTRWTVTADVTQREGEPAGAARARLGVAFEPVSGILLRANAERGGYRLGVGLLGTRTSVQAAQQRVDSERTAETYAWSWHEGEDQTQLRVPSEQRIAKVSIGGTLADEDLGGVSLFGGGGGTPSAPLHRQLERALEDPLTRGVLLDLRGVSGMAQLEELRPRVQKLRSAGKPVVAFLEYGGGRGDLFLASAADRIVATDEAFFGPLGLRAERRYYRQFLADQGIRVERSSIGAYKSAYRNLSVDATPQADSVVLQRVLDQQQQIFVETVGRARRLSPETLTGFLDGRPWRSVDLARGGVIDSVGHREDAMRMLGRLTGLGDRPRTVDLRRAPRARRTWTEPTRIAVVYAGGGIEVGRSGSDVLNGAFMGNETVIAQLERAFHAPGVRAVVLRVESPGGSTLASELIDHAVQRLKRETGKPLIVSMGSVAASGGYYISCHADRIFADRHTRTGSIGVLFMKPSLAGLYAKHHVRQEAFERGASMGAWSYSQDWTARDQAVADSAVSRTYQAFVRKVSEGRGIETWEVNAHAQGRVWLGEDAANKRLIDGIGGLDAAIVEARRRGGVPESEQIRLLELRRPRGSIVERLLGGALRSWVARELRAPEFEPLQAREDALLESLAD